MTKLRPFFLLALFLVLTSIITPASAQVQCYASTNVPTVMRSGGLTEPLADYFLDCYGGTPTPAGAPVPQINLTIFLNTVITSKITASDSTGVYTEVLALVDEPNTLAWPSGRPILNCGQTGAPDNGPSGPAVCSIVSTGIPTETYDGHPNTYGTSICGSFLVPGPPLNSYGCGRPNAFQGRFVPGGPNNAITFLGMPFDPPGPTGHRTIRIVNLRANANLLGPPTPPLFPAATATSAVSTPPSFPITIHFPPPPDQNLGYVISGLNPGACGAAPASTVRVCEGFTSSWKAKNLSFFVGDNLLTAGNGLYSGGKYIYNSNTNYPADIAQNVATSLYNTESIFEWQNSSPNGPPSPNPPVGFGPGTVPAIPGFPLGSAGFGGTNTNVAADGIATAGTRFALQFSGVPAGHSIQVPQFVYLHNPGCSQPCVSTGVMELTNADAAGGGPFSPAISTTLGANLMAVYEVLFTDPFSIEYADVPYTVTGGGSSANIMVSGSLAPFYSDPASGQPSLTGFLPRFASTSAGINGMMVVINGMELPAGITTSLNAKLEAALDAIAANHLEGACDSLSALINEARAQSGKKLTAAQANTIINMTIAIQRQLGC